MSAVSNNWAKKPTSGESTEQGINILIKQDSVSQRDACGKIELLSGIANDLKLDQKKAPAVNEQIAKIVQGLLRKKAYGRRFDGDTESLQPARKL